MESRRRKAKSGTPRRVTGKAVASEAPHSSAAASLILPNLEALLEGDAPKISIGAIEPIQCAPVAADPHNMLAALIRRPGETLQQLLECVDAAVYLALEEEVFTDEINTPTSRR